MMPEALYQFYTKIGTRFRLYSRVTLLALFLITLPGCLAEILSSRQGAVRFYPGLPAKCDQPTHLKQKDIKAVYSIQELEQHYRLTMLVEFQDGITPPLLGTIFYHDREDNYYCMVLPDGRFAAIDDIMLGHKHNMMQDICYPIKRCH